MASILDLYRQPSNWNYFQPIDRGDFSDWRQPPNRGLDASPMVNTPNVLGTNTANRYWTPPAAPTATGSSVGPFTAETLTKNPELAAILKKLYGDIGNLSTDPNVNQTVLQRNVKLPEVEAAGQAALTQQQADAHNNAQSIADFAKNFMAAQPAAQARADQEAANIGRVQSGALAADLAANQRSSDINSTQNLMRRLGALAGSANLGDLSRGGVTNSNANANVLQAAAQASLARDAAALAGGRQNIMDVQNLQIGTAGLPQRILDAVLQRQLTPIQAGQASSAADLNRLQGVAGLLAGNSVFTPQSRTGLVQQVQQLLQGQAGLDPSAYYRYVRGDFPNQNPGLVRQQPLNLPNPYANQGSGDNGQMIQQILAALNQGGQPSLTGGGSASGSSADNISPINGLISSYVNQGYQQPVISNWLSGLTPAQLATVPMEGYE